MHRLGTAILLTASVVACGDGATEADYDDVAAATAALIADDGGEIEGMEDVTDIAIGRPPLRYALNNAGVYTGVRSGIGFSFDYSFELTCSDANGEVQEVCDENTEQANAVLSWSGELDTARRYANLERSGNWTLSSLTSSVVEFNGTGTFSQDSEFEALDRPVSRTYMFDYSAQYNNVEFDRTMRRPVGGTIQYRVDAARTESRRFRDIDASFQVEVNVTFQPDGTAELVLDGDRRYVVTLSNGEVVAEDDEVE